MPDLPEMHDDDLFSLLRDERLGSEGPQAEGRKAALPLPSELLQRVSDDLARPRSAGLLSGRLLSKAARLTASALLLLLGLLGTTFKGWSLNPELLLAVATICAFGLGAGVLGLGVPAGKNHLRLEGRRAIVAVLLLALVGMLLARQSEAVPLSEFLSKSHVLAALKCAVHCLWTGGLYLAGLLFIWKRTDPFSPRLTGALMGVISGLLGNVGLSFLCSNLEVMHLFFGHGLAALVLGVVGQWSGPRVLSP
jgi:hypothetical protein